MTSNDSVTENILVKHNLDWFVCAAVSYFGFCGEMRELISLELLASQTERVRRRQLFAIVNILKENSTGYSIDLVGLHCLFQL